MYSLVVIMARRYIHYDDESTYVSVQELLLYEMENNDEESLEHTSCI